MTNQQLIDWLDAAIENIKMAVLGVGANHVDPSILPDADTLTILKSAREYLMIQQTKEGE